MRRRALAGDLLAVDIGNTKLAAVLYEGGRERGRWRIDYGGATGPRLRRAAAALTGAAPGVPVVVCSVAPQRLQQLGFMSRRRALHQADWRSPWPFRIAVRTPATLGADRLANVAGLHALGLRNGIAVDCGTAITIDVLREGVFRGGLILPGFELALAALAGGTARLPRVRLQLPVPLLGDDTASALRAGVYHTTWAGVASVVASLRDGYPSPCPVVVTGGAGELLGDLGSRGTHHEPDLLFLGLRALGARLRHPRVARKSL